MIEEPVVVVTEEQHYAGLHQVIPVAEIQRAIGQGLPEVGGVLVAQGIPPVGPWFTHHFHKPLETFDFEIGLPVARAIEPAGRVQPRVWPSMQVARTVYQGNYSGLPAAWGELEEWVKASGKRPGTEFWERYVVTPDGNPDPAEWRTELNWPLLD